MHDAETVHLLLAHNCYRHTYINKVFEEEQRKIDSDKGKENDCVRAWA